jgi:hypothetical protein
MRRPSGRVLRDTIDIYYAGGIGYSGLANSQNTTTADGGYSPAYNATPSISDFPCSVQYDGAAEGVMDELNRVTEIRRYAILCGQDPLVDARDMLVYVDNSGDSHTLFVEASNDQAGRGSCWRIQATERR